MEPDELARLVALRAEDGLAWAHEMMALTEDQRAAVLAFINQREAELEGQIAEREQRLLRALYHSGADMPDECSRCRRPGEGDEGWFVYVAGGSLAVTCPGCFVPEDRSLVVE